MKKNSVSLFLLLLFSFPSAPMAAGSSAQQYDAMGQALYDKGFYPQALEYFKVAVQTDPYDWQGFENLGHAYLKMNLYQDALDAFGKSLQINPDNADLKLLVENFNNQSLPMAPSQASPVMPAPAAVTQVPVADVVKPLQAQPGAETPLPSPRPSPVLSQPPPQTVSTPPPSAPQPGIKPVFFPFGGKLNPIDSAKVWFKGDMGFSYSLLGDYAGSASIENKMIQANGWTGSALMDNTGLSLGFEIGFLIDPNNGLALGAGFLRPNNYHLNQDLLNGNPADFENETFLTYALPLSLNYYFFLPDRAGRFFFSGGASFYFATVSVADNYSYLISHLGSNDVDNFSGDLAASGIGFQASAGREFAINSFLGVSVFARGRYARIGNFIGTVSRANGQTGQYGLASFQDGEVHAVDVSFIGSRGVNYATVDFTGFDAGLALSFYP